MLSVNSSSGLEFTESMLHYLQAEPFTSEIELLVEIPDLPNTRLKLSGVDECRQKIREQYLSYQKAAQPWLDLKGKVSQAIGPQEICNNGTAFLRLMNIAQTPTMGRIEGTRLELEYNPKKNNSRDGVTVEEVD